ncbi:WD40 repeat domain-containing protein [Azospirillum baldaniorum]|uniref:WD40 repeat domain-containing protein n=1 Tax=Azospirillum baldaniorum TaxID=1064539 RepID=UPI0011A9E9F4
MLEGHSNDVLAATFSSEGRRIATVSSDTLRLWDVFPDLDELSALVRSRLTRCLSIAQRERFGLSVEDRSRPRDLIPAPDAQGRCPQ